MKALALATNSVSFGSEKNIFSESLVSYFLGSNIRSSSATNPPSLLAAPIPTIQRRPCRRLPARNHHRRIEPALSELKIGRSLLEKPAISASRVIHQRLSSTALGTAGHQSASTSVLATFLSASKRQARL